MKMQGKFELEPNEIPMKVNLSTGEQSYLFPETKSTSKPGYVAFEPNAQFTKNYNKVWKMLNTMLTSDEYRVAHYMTTISKANTNSLEPLSDEMTAIKLAELLNIGRNKVKPVLKRLFDIGVYGTFKVSELTQVKEYWLLNPYLSFNGKLIKKDTVTLFDNTFIASLFRSCYHSADREEAVTA